MVGQDLRVTSARVSAIVHATEDSEKVRRALFYVCSKESLPWKVEERRLKGHHGNKISIINLTVHGASSSSFLDFLWKRLQRIDQEQVLGSLNSYVDESGRLHLRLSKQESLRGKLQIQDPDPIKVEVSIHTGQKTSVFVSDAIRKKLESMMS